MPNSKTLFVASSLALAIAASASAQMPPQQPDSKAFKIGSLDLVSLHDAQFVLPNDGKVFGVGHSPQRNW